MYAYLQFYDKDDILTNSPPAQRVPLSIYSPGGSIQISVGNNSPSLKVQRHHSTSSPQRNSPPQPTKDVFTCDFACGFAGSYEQVTAHEHRCSKNHAVASPQPEKVFNCDYSCGFAGSFQQVSKHESICSKNPAVASPQPEKVFCCDYRCGFAGSFQQVSAHESSCSKSPSKAKGARSGNGKE